MELAESIKAAWQAVEESGVPDHMQELAFKEALRSLLYTAPLQGAAGGRRTPATVQLKPDNDGDGDDAQQVSLDEAEVLQRVSDETGVAVERLEQVFLIDDGVVKLIGQHTKYGSTITDQARTVAQIVTVVRKLGMQHADTSFELIKEACETKHCYDRKNFASQHMPKIPGFVVRGQGKSRRLEAKGGGVSAFPDLISKVLGES